MTVVNVPDFISFSDVDLLKALVASDRRPNLLVDCQRELSGDLVRQLAGLCSPACQEVVIPGPLDLPGDECRTLLLHDVSKLTLQQQLTMSDWLRYRRRDTQVVSITTQPLILQVREGRFLEGLFYRLNTISISAMGR